MSDNNADRDIGQTSLDPEFLRVQILNAIAELEALSFFQDLGPMEDSGQVDTLLLRIADAVRALHQIDADVPLIDFTRIHPDFLRAMPDHPLLDAIGDMLNNLRREGVQKPQSLRSGTGHQLRICLAGGDTSICA